MERISAGHILRYFAVSPDPTSRADDRCSPSGLRTAVASFARGSATPAREGWGSFMARLGTFEWAER